MLFEMKTSFNFINKRADSGSSMLSIINLNYIKIISNF